MMNSSDYRNIEQQIGQELQKTPLAITPSSAEVQRIDQELPAEWTQTLEQEQEYTSEELRQLLDTPLDIPEGDIDANAQQALNELYQEGSIEPDMIIQETHEAPEIDLEYTQDVEDIDR